MACGRYEFRRLTFLYTNKCTSRCEHCSGACHPKKSEKLDPEIVRQCLEDVRSLGLSSFGLTGGEALIYFDEVVEILEYARSVGLSCQLGSNGFWGTSIERAGEMLAKLEALGVTRIFLSTDRYHVEFVSLDRIENILIASRQSKIVIDVKVCLLDGDRETPRLMRELSHRLGGQKIHFSAVATAPIGRARLSAFEFPSFDFDEVSGQTCPSPSEIYITPDGSVYICCVNATTYEDHRDQPIPLAIGNVRDTRFGEVLSRNRDNLLGKLLDGWGPGALAKHWMDEKGEGQQFRQRRYYGVCDLCTELMRSEPYTDFVAKTLGAPEVAAEINRQYTRSE